MKKFKKILVLVVLAGLVFYIARSLLPEEVVSDGFQANRHVRLDNDIVITQNIPAEDAKLTAVQLQFGTYKKVNTGVLNVSLYENDNIVKSWEINADELVDNAYQTFELSKPLVLQSANTYSVKVSYAFEGDNAIAIWTNSNVENGTFTANAKQYEGSVCYKLVHIK